LVMVSSSLTPDCAAPRLAASYARSNAQAAHDEERNP
jgi:hypothetical protein